MSFNPVIPDFRKILNTFGFKWKTNSVNSVTMVLKIK